MVAITKKAFIFLLISIFFMLGLAIPKNQQDVDQLIKAFQEADAVLNGYWLQVSFPYGNYTNDQQLLKEGQRLSSIFQLPVENRLVEIGNQKSYITKGIWSDDDEVELQLKRLGDEQPQMYLLFHLKGRDSLDDFRKHAAALREKTKALQISPIINACIQGKINDKLNHMEQSVLIESLLHSLAAKKVEVLDTKLVKSVSAFSPEIAHFIWTGHHKMNVQVATHVNHLEQTTILTLGTPIIAIEY